MRDRGDQRPDRREKTFREYVRKQAHARPADELHNERMRENGNKGALSQGRVRPAKGQTASLGTISGCGARKGRTAAIYIGSRKVLQGEMLCKVTCRLSAPGGPMKSLR